MKDWKNMFYHALDICDNCGIEYGEIVKVELNYRAKNRFGQCRRKPNGTFELNFNYLIFDDNADDNAIMDTIIHEILHTCYGCFNHGKKWKTLANIINNATGYNVSRCGNYADFGLESPKKEKARNYVFRCENCGQEIVRERMSHFVKLYDSYTCGCCGGKFQFIPEESNCQILTRKPVQK